MNGTTSLEALEVTPDADGECYLVIAFLYTC